MSRDRNILAEALSPAAVVASLREKGIVIAERAIRERARALGACRVLGKTMLLLPEHIELILAEPKQCPSSSTSAVKSGGIGARSPEDDYTRALKRLTEKRQKKSPAARKPASSNVISMDRPQS